MDVNGKVSVTAAFYIILDKYIGILFVWNKTNIIIYPKFLNTLNPYSSYPEHWT